MLERLFFAIVFARGGGVYNPLFLAMSATMNNSLVRSLLSLKNGNWYETRHQLWSDHIQFRQRYIRIGFEITTNIGQVALPLMVDYLRNNPATYACLFVSFVRECRKWAKVLEGLLIVAMINVFVLQITGEMDKNKKFGLDFQRRVR